jgi:hypothetical protein
VLQLQATIENAITVIIAREINFFIINFFYLWRTSQSVTKDRIKEANPTKAPRTVPRVFQNAILVVQPVFTITRSALISTS